MIDLALALDLHEHGLDWRPQAGDRFVIRATEMIDDVFHLADMVIEVREMESGGFFAFNGTTEWALDSVPQDKTVWLPREDQLRVRLGESFRSLSCQDNEFVVVVATEGEDREFRDRSAENAYGRALLAQLRART